MKQIIALVALSVVGISLLTTMALAAAATVLVAVIAALTLLPALLGLVGERICSDKAGKHQASAAPNTSTFASGWVTALLRHPEQLDGAQD